MREKREEREEKEDRIEEDGVIIERERYMKNEECLLCYAGVKKKKNI
jgi:hypothetical protein